MGCYVAVSDLEAPTKLYSSKISPFPNPVPKALGLVIWPEAPKGRIVLRGRFYQVPAEKTPERLPGAGGYLPSWLRNRTCLLGAQGRLRRDALRGCPREVSQRRTRASARLSSATPLLPEVTFGYFHKLPRPVTDRLGLFPGHPRAYAIVPDVS